MDLATIDDMGNVNREIFQKPENLQRVRYMMYFIGIFYEDQWPYPDILQTSHIIILPAN